MSDARIRIAIADYGMGNLRSVEKALAKVDARADRVTDPAAIGDEDGLVLPGVGAFPEAMDRIRSMGFDEAIADRVANGTPLLGICLGMQLIFERSEELGGAEGLGLLQGSVSAIDARGGKVPHMGWSPVSWRRPSRLTEGLADAEPFYFVHSFVARPSEDSDVLGASAYGEEFACVVEREKVFGAQFHPEKSSGAGLRMLRNFAAICAGVPAADAA